MKKKHLLSVFLCMLLILSTLGFPLSAYADNWRNYRSEATIPEERIAQRVIDEADILTDSEEESLLQKLDKINDNYGYDVVIATTRTLEDYTAQQFADDCYDYNGFDENGILLLISVESRDWAISTAGDAIDAFTDYDQELIMDSIIGYLGNDEWYNAFKGFASKCDLYIDNHLNYSDTNSNHYTYSYSNNTMTDNNNLTKTESLLVKIISTLLVGMIVGLVYAFVKKKNNNKKMLGNEVGFSTEPYIDGGVNIIDHYDRFIRNEHAERFVKTADSSSHSSHTSTTHQSSSGRIHGGSSGKF